MRGVSLKWKLARAWIYIYMYTCLAGDLGEQQWTVYVNIIIVSIVIVIVNSCIYSLANVDSLCALPIAFVQHVLCYYCLSSSSKELSFSSHTTQCSRPRFRVVVVAALVECDAQRAVVIVRAPPTTAEKVALRPLIDEDNNASLGLWWYCLWGLCCS